MRKYWVYIIIVIQLLLIGSLIKSIVSTVTSGRRLDELESKKLRVVEKNHQLVQKLQSLDSQYYLERVAREQLHLVKPGETVVMLPQAEARENIPKNEEDATNSVIENWIRVFVQVDISN